MKRKQNFSLPRRRLLSWIIFLAVSGLCTGCGRDVPEILVSMDAEKEQMEEKEEIVTESTIFVDVCGAVYSPGVYELSVGSRIFQALEMAGGMTEEAAPDCMNRARILNDGERVYVPTLEEAEEMKPLTETGAFQAETSAQTAGETGQSSRINLNTSDLETLMTLNGIGESKARAILTYRQEHGGFSSVEELLNVPGIKEGTFSKIKDKIAVE